MFNYKYIVNLTLRKKHKFCVEKHIFYKNNLYKIENYFMNKKNKYSDLLKITILLFKVKLILIIMNLSTIQQINDLFYYNNIKKYTKDTKLKKNK